MTDVKQHDGCWRLRIWIWTGDEEVFMEKDMFSTVMWTAKTKINKKKTAGLDDASQDLLQASSELRFTDYDHKTQTSWTSALETREGDALWDHFICSFKQPLVQKMSMNMNSLVWVHLLAWICFHCPFFWVKFQCWIGCQMNFSWALGAL